MKSYSVKEISELLGTNPETVRRWIRNGKLVADQASRKGGNSVTEAELQQFVKRTPKYAAIAAGGLAAAAPFVGLPIAIGGMIGGVLGLLDGSIKAKDIQLEAQDVIKALTDNIGQCTENIKRKQEAIAQLEKEIEAEEAQISALKNTIAQVESHLNE